MMSDKTKHKGMDRREFLKWTAYGAAALSASSVFIKVEKANASGIEKIDVTGIGEGKIPQLPIVSNKKFPGAEVIVASESGPPISSPIQKVGPQWEKATGAKIKLVTFPHGTMFEKERTALASGSYVFDLFNLQSGWCGDFMGGGYLEEVPGDVLKLINLDDYYPTYRAAMSWGGKMYGIVYDGNVHNLFYRRDLFENPEFGKRFKDKYGYDLQVPATWEQYHDIAEFFNSFDWSGTGRIGYGAVEPMGRGVGGVFFLIGRGISYSKTPGDPYVFFHPDTMKPRINEPGWVQALEDRKNDIAVGPKGVEQFGYSESRPAFVSGQTAMIADWGDIGTLSYDMSQSKIRGNCGTALVPGASKVFDRKTQKWVETPEGSYAPYLAVTAWLFGVPKKAKYKEAAWDLAAFLCNSVSSSVLVALPDSGIQPSRLSTIRDPDYLVTAGMGGQDAKDYLTAIGKAIGHENAVLDLRIPGTGEYYSIMDVEASRAMAGELTPQEAMDNAAKDWERTTDRLGRDRQRQLYIDSLKGAV